MQNELNKDVLNVLYKYFKQSVILQSNEELCCLNVDIAAADIELMWRYFRSNNAKVIAKYGSISARCKLDRRLLNIYLESNICANFERFMEYDNITNAGKSLILCVVGNNFEWHLYRCIPEYDLSARWMFATIQMSTSVRSKIAKELCEQMGYKNTLLYFYHLPH